MLLTALALVLLAAVLHASWNIAAKRAGGDHRFTLITIVITSVATRGRCVAAQQRALGCALGPDRPCRGLRAETRA